MLPGCTLVWGYLALTRRGALPFTSYEHQKKMWGCIYSRYTQNTVEKRTTTSCRKPFGSEKSDGIRGWFDVWMLGSYMMMKQKKSVDSVPVRASLPATTPFPYQVTGGALVVLRLIGIVFSNRAEASSQYHQAKPKMLICQSLLYMYLVWAMWPVEHSVNHSGSVFFLLNQLTTIGGRLFKKDGSSAQNGWRRAKQNQSWKIVAFRSVTQWAWASQVRPFVREEGEQPKPPPVFAYKGGIKAPQLWRRCLYGYPTNRWTWFINCVSMLQRSWPYPSCSVALCTCTYFWAFAGMNTSIQCSRWSEAEVCWRLKLVVNFSVGICLMDHMDQTDHETRTSNMWLPVTAYAGQNQDPRGPECAIETVSQRPGEFHGDEFFWSLSGRLRPSRDEIRNENLAIFCVMRLF